jgi:hypothetical protein
LTHALLAGSPAIDAGNQAACQLTDQRGVSRPQDGDGNGIATCDIGAFESQPSKPFVIEGTIGTRVTLTGSDFGEKKGKILIGDLKQKIDNWMPTSISFMVTKVPPVSTYDINIVPYKAAYIPLSDAFTVMVPQIDSLNSYNGVAGVTQITISGNFFSTKRGKVYLEYEKNGQSKKKKCKVISWGMDSITFVVPKGLVSGNTYPLKVINKVGLAGAPSDFTID